jgi:hypothetical protein
MTLPVSFWMMVTCAWLTSRAYQPINWKKFETPLTPAAAQAFFPEALPGKMYVKVLDTQCS